MIDRTELFIGTAVQAAHHLSRADIFGEMTDHPDDIFIPAHTEGSICHPCQWPEMAYVDFGHLGQWLVRTDQISLVLPS